MAKKLVCLLMALVWIHGVLAAEKPLTGAILDGDAPDLAAKNFHAPVVKKTAKPDYPFILRRQDISGSALVECVVDTEGKVHQARAIKATRSEFGDAAAACIVKWKYLPGSLEGVPVNVRIRVPFQFTLNRR